MMGRTHMVIGIGATAIALMPLQLDPLTSIISLGIGTMASVLPDIDAGGNVKVRTMLGLGDEQTTRQLRRTISRRFSLLAFLLALVRWGIAQLLNLIPTLIQHRGPTHWGISWLGVSVVAGFCLPLPYAVAFSVGYLSHILADMMTVSGIAVFAPVVPVDKATGNGTFHLLPKPYRIRTGSRIEAMLCILLLAVETTILFLYSVSFFMGSRA